MKMIIFRLQHFYSIVLRLDSMTMGDCPYALHVGTVRDSNFYFFTES